MGPNTQRLLQYLDNLDAVEEANIQAYLNKELLEELFNLESEFAYDRPTADETMYTDTAFERAVLRRELNEISPGLGDNPDVVEQYAALKAKKRGEIMAQGGEGSPSSIPNSALGMYDLF